ncbi:hypothetical protein GPECTOR_2g1157 [Gonium pectorale]|uniref:Protein kinase domain-containing protein n=1 Tax=Gonium pectorale TaxID=33097 RepID=A0A150H0B0_GONPE|nr:hypothetical protein GPECTOR_2g1157 [Gonium pectorale]|eukprot:KXZ55607.1 hypothetical protein GPECTOR_2g1157 [Gonium pectorale]
MFDQVREAAHQASEQHTGSGGKGRSSRPTAGLKAAAAAAAAAARGTGNYSDCQALVWLAEVADAMTYVHSRQPVLIHRDLKAIDSTGAKMPPPQVLRAPGQPRMEPHAASPQQGQQAQKHDDAKAGRAAAIRGAASAKALFCGGAAGSGGSGSPGRLLAPADAPALGLKGWPWQTLGQPHGQGQAQWSAGSAASSPAMVSPAQQAGAQAGAGTNCGTPGTSTAPTQGHVPSAPARALQSAISMPQLALHGILPSPPPPQQRQAMTQAGSAAPGGGGGPLANGEPMPQHPGAPDHRCASAGGLLPASPMKFGTLLSAKAVAGGGAADANGHSPAITGARRDAPDAVPAGAPPPPRMSETGHAQVRIEQLNGLLRLGKGHRDYLPDMYQMTFNLTGQCGSVCYMAPEVARLLPYNQKADVYSYGCIMYEVLTRQLLSDGLVDGDADGAMEYLGRVAWSGWRPDLPASMPKELRLLVSLCWHRVRLRCA